MKPFEQEVTERLAANEANEPLRTAAEQFLVASIPARYSYNFSWMGRPIIQYPQDIVAMQEIVWRVRPDLIIETGIAHGGSLIFYASMLELLGAGEVIGIDIDIRAHNRAAIEAHPLARRIRMLQGSSIAPEIVAQVAELARGKRVLVSLDSNHTHGHVLAELEAYAPLVSVGSYCVVFDTLIEQLPPGTYRDRPWDVGDNPATAVAAYLERDDRFVVDTGIDAQLLVSVARGGYLKRVR